MFLRRQRSSTDEDLVSRIKLGDAEAWAELLGRYSDLIYSKAVQYSEAIGYRWPSREEREDEISSLYLFMAERLKRSFDYFEGRNDCKVRTWIYSIIGNKKQMIKAYLMEKYPRRADVRLPRCMEGRSELEVEVFRRLVWGHSYEQIAWDLGLEVHEAREICEKLLSLLKSESPRVYERIMLNRTAVVPLTSLDRKAEEDDGIPFEPVDTSPLPDSFPDRMKVLEAIGEGLNGLEEDQLRLLMLRYDEGMKAKDIAEYAGQLGLEGITERGQVYHLIEKALRNVLSLVKARLTDPSIGDVRPDDAEKEMLDCMKQILEKYGVRFFLQRTHSSDT